MKLQFTDPKSKLIWEQVTFHEHPLIVPSIGSEVKLPNGIRYSVVRCFVDYSSIRGGGDHFHVLAKITVKEIPDD